MSILDVPPPDGAFSITIAEHARRTVRRYNPPGRVVWFTIRPTRYFRVEILQGYKSEAAAVVTFHF